MDQTDQKINFLEFFQGFLLRHFFHIDAVAWALIGLFMFFMVFWVKSLNAKKILTPSRFAPSVMTSAGLLGTFIGLSYGLKDLNLSNQDSMQDLVDGLKLVFVYSLVGVASAIWFMLLNMIPTGLQVQRMNKTADQNKQQHQTHNQELLTLLKQQRDAQQQMAAEIAKLQFDSDNQELGRIIAEGVTQGVVSGLSPMLLEIKNAVADQGGEAIRQVLDDLKAEILVPMQHSLNHTNSALGETNQAVLAMIKVVEETQAHSTELITAVGQASEQMVTASEKMSGLVDKIDQTVTHMGEIQERQKASLDQFNMDLQANLAQIKPAIEEGLNTAKEGLTAAIGVAASLMQNSIAQASDAMVTNLNAALNQAGTQLNDTIGLATQNLTSAVADTTDRLNMSVQGALKGFDTAQQKLDDTLQSFSGQMNGHLDRMATELEQIGDTAQGLIQTASNNLEKTLGDIDDKLLNTSQVLQDSLEKFREEYQARLTEYLDQQQQRLDGFLDEQNKQLEATIGQQREGLVIVTNDLKQAFADATLQHRTVVDSQQNLLQRLDATQESLLPKIGEIARELGQGEQKMVVQLKNANDALGQVARSLQDMGQQLPVEFAKTFEQLDQKYREAFSHLDSGLADTVGVLLAAAEALVQSSGLNDMLKQR